MTITFGNGNDNGNGKPIPKIKGLTPTGSRFLVEMFTTQETLGTHIIIGEKSKVPVPSRLSVKVALVGVPVEDNVGIVPSGSDELISKFKLL